jgi:hypothetical protein
VALARSSPKWTGADLPAPAEVVEEEIEKVDGGPVHPLMVEHDPDKARGEGRLQLRQQGGKALLPGHGSRRVCRSTLTAKLAVSPAGAGGVLPRLRETIGKPSSSRVDRVAAEQRFQGGVKAGWKASPCRSPQPVASL